MPKGSHHVQVPTNLFCSSKRKRIEMGTEVKRARSNSEPYLAEESGSGWWKNHPACMERFLPHLERVTGASRNQMSLVPNRTSANVQFWLQVSLWRGYVSRFVLKTQYFYLKYPKTDESRTCVQDPCRKHSQNRQQIGVNFKPPFIKHRCHRSVSRASSSKLFFFI